MPDAQNPGAVARHSAELDRCNQRGGRMLSVFDLLDAGTLGLDLASVLMARISRGDSFLVGARPGGAGKTTVMCALLNFVPAGHELVAATPAAIRAGASPSPASRCYVGHEIGAGHYFAYLWGAELRAYCTLADTGSMLATNLHADDLYEARAQICDENGVPERQFHKFHLALFLRVRGGYARAQRTISKAYISDGATPHQLLFSEERGIDSSALSSDPQEKARIEQCKTFLDETRRSGARTIQETRAAVIGFLAESSSPTPHFGL